ncbi:expansin module family protein [Irpex rosettiformis]|uniref:Expansin module family protein n=1 Tax=Irpex rosettiformis TaxID=378272 RepID=A0ACB8U725_9APHY|nr:expansin module family protein [Irpex rosettiformis]
MTRLSQLVSFTVLAAATLAGAAPAKRQIGETHAGDATFYATGLGACGIVNNDRDHIVAVSGLLYDSYPGTTPNSYPICGKQMTVTYQGRSTTVTVADRCAVDACAMNDIVLSPVAFTDLSPLDAGRIRVTWVWDD